MGATQSCQLPASTLSNPLTMATTSGVSRPKYSPSIVHKSATFEPFQKSKTLQYNVPAPKFGEDPSGEEPTRASLQEDTYPMMLKDARKDLMQ